MALTEKQIKNLKKGDPLIIHGTFVEMTRLGNLCIKSYKLSSLGSVISTNMEYIHSSAVSLDDPRYKTSYEPMHKNLHDPCRKFKKGDIVTPKLVNGRSYARSLDNIIGDKCIVGSDETPYHVISIYHGNERHYADPAYLELITPVEELGTYSVQETMNHDGWQIVRDGLPLVLYDVQRHPDAKAAAEAECKRLNTEWLKEHENKYFQNGN